MPPVVNIRPRTLPDASDTPRGARAFRQAANVLLADQQREEVREFRSDEAEKQRQARRDLERLRADIEGGLIGRRAEERRRTIGRQTDAAIRRFEETTGPLRERALDLRERGLGLRAEDVDLRRDLGEGRLELRRDLGERRLDIQGQRNLQRFNLGLAQLNQRNQAGRLRARSRIGAQVARGLADPFSTITGGQARGLMSLVEGDEAGADRLRAAPPGQAGIGLSDLETGGGLRGGPRGVRGQGGTAESLGGRVELDVPEQVSPRRHIEFMQDFLDSDRERQIYLQSLPRRQQLQVLESIRGTGGR